MKRLIAALVLLLGGIAGVLGYTEASREREYQRLIDQGDVALAKDETFVAIEAYSGAIALKNDSMLGYLKRGETYRQRGELTEALRDLRTAAELDPTAPRPLERLGDVNYSLNRFSRAAERYAAYIRLDDRSPRVLYKLALTRYRDGQPARGLQPLRQAIALDEKFVEAHYLLGLALMERDQLAEARRAFERAVTLAPDFIPARDQLVELYRARRDAKAAMSHLERLAQLEPHRPERLVALGLGHAEIGRTDLAVLTLRRAAERFPDEPQIYTALGRVWLNVAQSQSRRDRVSLNKALEALDRVTTMAGATGEALALYGEALRLSGNLARAEQVLLQAVRRPPIESAMLLSLADTAERLGHLAVARDALADYTAVVAETVDLTPHVTRLADLSLRVNDPTAASMWFERALQGPRADSSSLLARLADAQLRAGKQQAARETIERGLALDPRNTRLRALELKAQKQKGKGKR